MTGIEKIFLEPTEKYVASVGNDYLQNFLTNGKVQTGFAAASNKRVYFKGTCYSKVEKKIFKTHEERVVDLKDITGTGYNNINQTWMLIASILCAIITILIVILMALTSPSDFPDFLVKLITISFFISLPLSIFLFVFYKMKKLFLFEISYGGGKICFDTKWYGKAEIDDFQKQLRLAKDAISSVKPKEVADIPQPTIINQIVKASVADELKKYAELLKDGIITQDEFDALKAKQLEG